VPVTVRDVIAPRSRPVRRGALLAVLVAAQVLTVANANMIAVALPPLARDLGASATQQQWIVDAYVLVFAALLVAGGVLGDRYGRRRALTGGLVLFAGGSLACALSPDPGVLIAARVVQGLAPALVLPASLAIVAANHADPLERSRAIGIWGAGSGFGVAMGPLLGGLVVAALGWRWVFALSAPAALALAAAAVRFVPADRPSGARRPFDALGAVLITAGIAGIVFGIIEGRERGWTSPAVIAAFAAGAALLAGFAAVERRHPAPLVDLALLGRRRFAAANVGGATVMFATLGTTVYLSAFLQGVRDLTPLEAGLALVPLGGAVAALASVAGRSTARVAPRTLMTGGMLCSALGALLLGRIHAGDGAADVLPALLLIGAGAGIALPAMTFPAISAAPGPQTGMASAVHNASRQLGATLGVAVLGSIVFSHGSLDSGLRVAFVVAAALLAAAAGGTLVLVPRS
jgi:MFS transporter, DHA2 family, methylenomycin A resistance protein